MVDVNFSETNLLEIHRRDFWDAWEGHRAKKSREFFDALPSAMFALAFFYAATSTIVIIFPAIFALVALVHAQSGWVSMRQQQAYEKALVDELEFEHKRLGHISFDAATYEGKKWTKKDMMEVLAQFTTMHSIRRLQVRVEAYSSFDKAQLLMLDQKLQEVDDIGKRIEENQETEKLVADNAENQPVPEAVNVAPHNQSKSHQSGPDQSKPDQNKNKRRVDKPFYRANKKPSKS